MFLLAPCPALWYDAGGMAKKFVVCAFLLCLVGLNASVCWCAWEVKKAAKAFYVDVRAPEISFDTYRIESQLEQIASVIDKRMQYMRVSVGGDVEVRGSLGIDGNVKTDIESMPNLLAEPVTVRPEMFGFPVMINDPVRVKAY